MCVLRWARCESLWKGLSMRSIAQWLWVVLASRESLERSMVSTFPSVDGIGRVHQHHRLETKVWTWHKEFNTYVYILYYLGPYWWWCRILFRICRSTQRTNTHTHTLRYIDYASTVWDIERQHKKYEDSYKYKYIKMIENTSRFFYKLTFFF